MASDSKAPVVAALVLLNVAVLGAIGWQLTQRAVEVPAGATGGATVDVSGAVTAPPAPADEGIDWSARFAEDAGEDVLCEGCNLLLISLDIFRPDHMPCMGYPAETAPNICELAAHGTLLESFIVHAYQTPVSQMSLFTGRYPSSSGFVSFASQLSPEVPYLPESLKAAGYSTVAMGSSFEVMTDMSNASSKRRSFTRQGLNPGLSFGRGFDRFVFTGNRNIPTDAIPWLQQSGDEPFFLWLILGTLHWPYGNQADPADRDRFDPPGYDGPFASGRLSRLGFDELSHIYRGRLYGDTPDQSQPLDEADDAFINARYDVGLWEVDRFIGDLLDGIPEEVLKDTLIVLHGVHGEDLGEHGYYGHYDVYDTEVRMAMVVLNPRHRAEGVRISEQVEGVDLAPTLLEILGLPPLPGTDGESFAGVLRDGRGDPERVTFFQRIPLWEDIFRHKSNMPTAFVEKVTEVLDREVVGDTGARTDRWKLLHRTARAVEQEVSWWTWLSGQPVERPEWELYDLEADPDEQRDVIGDHPEVAEALKARLLEWEASLVREAP